MRNLEHVAILLDETLTTVKVHFKVSINYVGRVKEYVGGDTYTYLCEKSLANTLNIGDVLIVEDAGAQVKIVQLASIDDESDILADTDIVYKFVVGKVDTNYQINMRKRINDQVQSLKSMQRAKMRQQMKQELMLEYKEAVNVIDQDSTTSQNESDVL